MAALSWDEYISLLEKRGAAIPRDRLSALRALYVELRTNLRRNVDWKVDFAYLHALLQLHEVDAETVYGGFECRPWRPPKDKELLKVFEMGEKVQKHRREKVTALWRRLKKAQRHDDTIKREYDWVFRLLFLAEPRAEKLLDDAGRGANLPVQKETDKFKGVELWDEVKTPVTVASNTFANPHQAFPPFPAQGRAEVGVAGQELQNGDQIRGVRKKLKSGPLPSSHDARPAFSPAPPAKTNKAPDGQSAQPPPRDMPPPSSIPPTADAGVTSVPDACCQPGNPCVLCRGRRLGLSFSPIIPFFDTTLDGKLEVGGSSVDQLEEGKTCMPEDDEYEEEEEYQEDGEFQGDVEYDEEVDFENMPLVDLGDSHGEQVRLKQAKQKSRKRKRQGDAEPESIFIIPDPEVMRRRMEIRAYRERKRPVDTNPRLDGKFRHYPRVGDWKCKNCKWWNKRFEFYCQRPNSDCINMRIPEHIECVQQDDGIAEFRAGGHHMGAWYCGRHNHQTGQNCMQWNHAYRPDCHLCKKPKEEVPAFVMPDGEGLPEPTEAQRYTDQEKRNMYWKAKGRMIRPRKKPW